MQINGLDLHVVDEGNSDVPLVLVHGFTGGVSDWDDVAPTLAKTRRVIRYSHRGHAESQNTGDQSSYTFTQLSDDLAALVDALGLGRFDLLGHSMGGATVMRYVLDHPERVRSLILMDTAAEPQNALPMDLIEGLAQQGREQGMQVVVEVMAPFIGALQDKLSPERRQQLADRYGPKMANMDPEAFVAFARGLNEYPSMVAQLKTITCPTTVIVGENDTGLRDGSDVMAREIPGAQLVAIPGAGHSPQEDDPDAWLEAVEAHLTRV
ncbi:MAG: alpha/beta hydrolase [Acidimicrobiales bacterium]|nr:alpha/beta hydrolase [Acidimicrobiales bacterium]